MLCYHYQDNKSDNQIKNSLTRDKRLRLLKFKIAVKSWTIGSFEFQLKPSLLSHFIGKQKL